MRETILSPVPQWGILAQWHSRLTCWEANYKLARKLMAKFPGLLLVLALVVSGCDRPSQPRHTLQSKTNVFLGTFEVTSSNLVAGDPGYDLDTFKTPGLGALLTNCHSGTWNAQTVIKHFAPPAFSLTSELLAWHTNVTNPSTLKWQKQKGGIGVDGGQAGIFDLAHFSDQKIVPADVKWTQGKPGPIIPENLWYSLCCEVTLGRAEGGVIPFGAVSTSGMGDGGYEYFVARDDKGIIIGVWILFVDDQGKG